METLDVEFGSMITQTVLPGLVSLVHITQTGMWLVLCN